MESHAVSKLTGSPPGYVGHEDHPGFLENVRKYPYSLILMDEIEKAHPQVLNLLLQILDEGHLTDSHGRKINFKNTVVVMTSNLGTDVYEEKSIGFVAPEETDKHVDVKKQAIKDLRPEFVNRIDDIIVFDLLTQKDLKDIANLQCKIFAARVKSNYNIRVTFDDNVVDFIVELGDNKSYGAREIKRNFRKHVENKLAEYLVSSKSTGKDLNVIFEKSIIKIKELP
jgi:ATP-dependent Clp protease ATP-binding subunit ClpC